VRLPALTLVALVAAAVLADAPRPVYVVIVHPTTAVSRLDRKQLEDIFLRRATRWPDDTPIRPVDLGPGSSTRARFSQEILSRPLTAVRSYWQQRIFSGQGLPPPELANDEEVVTYVLTHPGAIGYVASGTPLNGAPVVELN
jgi:ABC-type phosphate transport system substrate-binding protein